MSVRSTLNWNALIFDTYSPKQIAWAVGDSHWQDVRVTMLAQPMETKYDILSRHLAEQRYSLRSKIQVTNYVNALKRGGLIK